MSWKGYDGQSLQGTKKQVDGKLPFPGQKPGAKMKFQNTSRNMGNS